MATASSASRRTQVLHHILLEDFQQKPTKNIGSLAGASDSSTSLASFSSLSTTPHLVTPDTSTLPLPAPTPSKAGRSVRSPNTSLVSLLEPIIELRKEEELGRIRERKREQRRLQAKSQSVSSPHLPLQVATGTPYPHQQLDSCAIDETDPLPLGLHLDEKRKRASLFPSENKEGPPEEPKSPPPQILRAAPAAHAFAHRQQARREARLGKLRAGSASTPTLTADCNSVYGKSNGPAFSSTNLRGHTHVNGSRATKSTANLVSYSAQSGSNVTLSPTQRWTGSSEDLESPVESPVVSGDYPHHLAGLASTSSVNVAGPWSPSVPLENTIGHSAVELDDEEERPSLEEASSAEVHQDATPPSSSGPVPPPGTKHLGPGGSKWASRSTLSLLLFGSSSGVHSKLPSNDSEVSSGTASTELGYAQRHNASRGSFLSFATSRSGAATPMATTRNQTGTSNVGSDGTTAAQDAPRHRFLGKAFKSPYRHKIYAETAEYIGPRREPAVVRAQRLLWRGREPKVVRTVHNAICGHFGDRYTI